MSERLIDSVCPNCGRLGTTVRVVKHEDGFTKLSRLCKECGGEWTNSFDADWLAVAKMRRLKAEVERLTRDRDEAQSKETDYHEGLEEGWDAAQEAAAAENERLLMDNNALRAEVERLREENQQLWAGLIETLDRLDTMAPNATRRV